MQESVPRLIVSDAAGNERVIEIQETPFTIGRQTDNDLVLLDHRISRRHAQILRDSQGYLLEDMESRHGTFVNGERAKRCLLNDGDRIGLGLTDDYRLTYRATEASLSVLLEEIQKPAESPTPRLQHLNLLLQVAQMLHRAAALDEVLTAVVDSVLQLFDAAHGYLFLTDEAGKPQLRLARTRSATLPPTPSADRWMEIVTRVMKTRREEVIFSDLSDARTILNASAQSAEQQGAVVLPLQKPPAAWSGSESLRQDAPELVGVLYVEGGERAAAITRLDRQALDTLTLESAMIIENARLIRVAREQERSRNEMSVAQRIQESLLPRSLPQAGHFLINALTTPCRTVGGDYYDFVPLPGERFGLAVADVSGKGLPAAMMAMTLQGAFSALAAADLPLPELFHKVNSFLCERTPMEMYATLFYGVFDPAGSVQFINAGHVPPMVLRTGGNVEVLDSPNFPLGMFEGASYSVSTLQLKEGEQILVFSDGLTEAQNEVHELLGEARVREIFEACYAEQCQPEQICSKLVRAAENFSGSAPQADDVTVALLRFAGTEAHPAI